MFGITNFPAFIIAGILLNLTPGTDTMFILGRSISLGRKAGVYSALGISAGCCVHTILAAFGLSAIVAQSEMVFDVIKYAGALYLFYLGIRMIIANSNSDFELNSGTESNFKNIFASGILTNVLNPKVALFFLAFLPQFVEKGHADSPVPFLILGLTFIFTGTFWCMMLVFFSSSLAARIKENFRAKAWLDRATGTIFITLGIKLAMEKR